MSKPTLLLSLGIGWCATSPLRFTLQRTYHYTHTGWRKEPHYLTQLDLNAHPTQRKKHHKRLADAAKPGIQNTHPRLAKTLSPATIPFYERFASYPLSIDKYISYYKAIHESVKDTYKTVADFSTTNHTLSQSAVEKYLPVLQEHFNVKPFIILRDPVRRSWSEYNHRYYNLKLGGSSTCTEYFLNNLTSSSSSQYMDVINLWEKYSELGVFVMEDLWDNNNLQPLRDFFEYPFTSLHPNAYSPDRGPYVKKGIRDLSDQWGSDHELLTEETYNTAKSLIQHVYDQWVDKYKSLPLYWGSPLKYS